jgi:TonB family protein
MRHTLFTLILLILLVSPVVAQENKVQDQKPTTPGTAETEKPKNAVDQILEDAAKRGEVIIGSCLNEDCVKDDATGVESGRILVMPKPGYPAIARAAHAEGEVEVKVIIGEEGTVIAAASISGHPLLQAASVAAARDAVFTPTRFYGKPVKVVGVIKYNFVLQ